MKVDGSCHCGKITFEAEVDPYKVTICHCTDCQRLTGTAFRVSVPAAADALRFISGTPRTYRKTADSGKQRVQGFCGDCGTPIYSTSASAQPSYYGLRVGCLAQCGQLAPRQEVWLRSPLPGSRTCPVNGHMNARVSRGRTLVIHKQDFSRLGSSANFRKIAPCTFISIRSRP